MITPWIFFLKEDEQLLVESFTRRWTINGPGIYVTGFFQNAKLQKGITLGPTEYLRIRDILTGKLRNEFGPKLYFPLASEEIVEKLAMIPLKNNEYVQIIDNSTGVIRVEKGEKSVYLNPTEQIVNKVMTCINIDEQTAVLVRDTTTGQLSLITDHQVFAPTANQTMVEIRKRILLADHETVIIKDNAGRYVFKRGNNAERAFFLEPYSELVQLLWSSGIHKDQRTLKITHIDSRPKFMWYEFEARTQDNVELIVGITFFWQIVDVESMISTTDDAPGDLCSHARSSIIQAVSQVTLERFLAAFNAIIYDAVLIADDGFYGERGIKIHAVEVRSVTCKDPATQHILQEIIQETTNRLNRIQKQESENEIKLKHIRGETEAEQLRRELLDIQREHTRLMALSEGEAEANKLKAFLSGLGDSLTAEEKIALFHVLRKEEMLEKLSKGSAQLYFTPADVDLSIEAR